MRVSISVSRPLGMETSNGVGVTLAVEGGVLNGFDMAWFIEL